MSNGTSKEFRSDVQGVRAIGAMLVAVFHIWIGEVSGGVDVFFVISGYFMSTGLLVLYKKDQSISLAIFYQNFLLKIVPQAVCVLGVLLFTSFFITSPVSFLSLLNDIAASAAYIQNWHLINVGQDYLSRTDSLNLLQHFWAISIIGQAYLVWPLLVILAERLAFAVRGSKEAVLTFLILALSVASFIWALYSLHRDPTSAYFDSFARFWEFGVGILAGLFPKLRKEIGRRVADPLSLIGLILLLTCGYFIGGSESFPGVGSLWPVAAAFLLIIAGSDGSRLNAGWLLSSRPLIWLAPLSFGIYLWHWPIYAVYMEYSKGNSPPLWIGLCIIFLAVVFAKLFKFLSDAGVYITRKTIGDAISALVVLIVLLCIFTGTIFFEKIAWKYRQELEKIINDRKAIAVEQSPFSVSRDLPQVYANGCHQNIKSLSVSECTINPHGVSGTLMVVGGSHSTHWLPALEMVAIKNNWKIISVTKSACIFGDVSDNELFGRRDPSCKIWNEKVYQRILEIKPQMVFTILTRTHRSAAGVEERIPSGYATVFSKLADRGITVLAMRDNPWMGYDVPRCWFSPWRTGIDECNQPRNKVLNDSQYKNELIKIDARVKVIDLTDEFCDESQCRVLHNKTLMYRDSHHITSAYARVLFEKLHEKIGRSLAE